MKIRESGMPEEKEWSKYFNPSKTLRSLGLNEYILDVADFGSGYGTFTIPAAKIIRGRIYALDIEPKMIEIIEIKAKENNLNNIVPILRDFMETGSGLKDNSLDYVMLFNILHVSKPEILLKEAFRILKSCGELGVTHWKYDSTTPRGPPMDIRPKPEQCKKWAETTGFIFTKESDLEPYHYGLLFRKNQ